LPVDTSNDATMMVALGLEPRSTFVPLSSSMDRYEHFSVWASEKLL
jgi:hypothetical protein